MIFLTVGTQLPFDRLAKAVDEWAARNPDVEVFGQIGKPARDGYLPRFFDWRSSLAPEDFSAQVERCAMIVAHAGMGSILTALDRRRPIILLPRREALGEHRSEHQVSTAKRMEDKRGLHVAWETEDVAPLIDKVRADAAQSDFEPIGPYAEAGLINALRQQIIGS